MVQALNGLSHVLIGPFSGRAKRLTHGLGTGLKMALALVPALVLTLVLTLALATTLLTSGCGGGERIRDVFFSLSSEVALSPGSQPIPGTLRVNPLAARGFLGGSRIVYRTAEAPMQVQRYNEFLWESVPARAVADDMLAALRAGRVFENVVTAGDPARADYLLTGELTLFDHLPTGWPAGGLPSGAMDQPLRRSTRLSPGVAIEFSLALVDGRNRRLLVSETYSGFEPTAADATGRTTPEAMVAAFNRLSGRLIGELVRDAQSQTQPQTQPQTKSQTHSQTQSGESR